MKHAWFLLLAMASGCTKSGPDPVEQVRDTVLAEERARWGDVKREDIEVDLRGKLAPGVTHATAYNVWVKDVPGYSCLIVSDQVRCGWGEALLGWVVAERHLGRDAAKLDDAAWLALLDAAGWESVDPDEVRARLFTGVPEEVQRQLEGPRVTRPAGGGVQVEMISPVVHLPIGLVGYDRVRVVVGADDTVSVTEAELVRID